MFFDTHVLTELEFFYNNLHYITDDIVSPKMTFQPL